mgnify:CR=1 FL=1
MTKEEFLEDCAYYNNCAKCPYGEYINEGYTCTVNEEELED